MSRVAAFALILLAGTASAQTLGDAAAKERQRRERLQQKPTPAPRVITEAELAANKGRLANEPAAPAATVSTPARRGSADDAPLALSIADVPSPSSRTSSVDAERARMETREVHWRQEAQRRRAALAEAEENLQRTSRWSDPTYAGKDRPWCPLEARHEQKKARAAVEQARQSMATLEEDARRGGALPGWVR